MNIVNNFLFALAVVIDYVLFFFLIVIVARAVLSWVSPDPYNPIVRFIHSVTEPVLYQVRKKIPVILGGIDFSPVIIILIVIFLQNFVVKTLKQFADKGM